MLPDGVLNAYAAKGTADAPPEYVQLVMKVVQAMLNDDETNLLTLNVKVTAVLPMCDLELS